MGERWRLNPDGVLELIDESSGNVIAVQKQKPEKVQSLAPRKTKGRGTGRGARSKEGAIICVTDAQGRTVWVPGGTNPDSLPRVIFPFSQVTCDHIAMLITQGHTLQEICAMDGIPPQHVVYRWMREHPEFRADIKKAREARAEYFADLAIETAEGAKEFNVQSSRLKVDTYKWAAEVNDRNTYAKHLKVTGDPEAPIGFILDTGIRREEAPIEVTKVEDKE